MNKEERIKLHKIFLTNLNKAKEQRPGDLAVLKRASGRTLAESKTALGVFFKYLPFQLTKSFNEEIYFLVATLYSLNDYPFKGSLGKTMRKIYKKSGSESIQNRMIILLDCQFELLDNYYPGGGDMAFRLRQCVRLASSHEIGVDWLQLIENLIYWTHEDKFVQKKWARDFFSHQEGEPDKNVEKNN